MEGFDEKILAAHKALANNDLQEANRLVLELKKDISLISNSILAAQFRADVGGLMIDLGSWENNETQVEEGTKYAAEVLSVLPLKQHLVEHYYNAANGYSALWKFRSSQAFKEGHLDNSIQEAKKLYRRAIDIAQPQFIIQNRHLYNQLLVNFANCYDSVSRNIEAVSQYDKALTIDPVMGMALGNKGITLYRLARLAQGYSHIFYLEALSLLTEAMETPLDKRAKDTFGHYIDNVKAVIDRHGEMKPEEIYNTKPLSQFHDFLRQFCVRHELFLTPTTLVGKGKTVVFGDPLFISTMVAPLSDETKFDRYVTYLNQIKQDYVLARYMLVQSQYKSEIIEAVDDGVALFYPLDYSLHSSYIQMLKTAFRLAVDVLDKIAFFVRDYYEVKSVSDRDVYFRSLFSSAKTPLNLRPELANKNNPYLFALLDLALDLKKDSYYESVHERRNALTHRVLVIHDIVMTKDKADDHIPRVFLNDFIRECIQVMQITRIAVIYLILMVDFEEKRAKKEGNFGLIHGTPVDDIFRWTPSNPHRKK